MLKISKWLLFAFITSLSLYACVPIGTDTVITTKDYDKSCTKDEDCVAVIVGDVCGCSCTMEFINTNALASFSDARNAKLQNCVNEVLHCAPCQEVKTVCSDKVCVQAP
ncbi:MAG: hypothetical protein CL920_28970 [Deltaproteobacteria bacterium]|nr:hypothetical protein [Deltaproteobacteria bacterium]